MFNASAVVLADRFAPGVILVGQDCLYVSLESKDLQMILLGSHFFICSSYFLDSGIMCCFMKTFCLFHIFRQVHSNYVLDHKFFFHIWTLKKFFP